MIKRLPISHISCLQNFPDLPAAIKKKRQTTASSAPWYHHRRCKQCLCMYKAPCLARTCWAASQTLFYCWILPHSAATFPNKLGNTVVLAVLISRARIVSMNSAAVPKMLSQQVGKMCPLLGISLQLPATWYTSVPFDHRWSKPSPLVASQLVAMGCI